MPSTFGGVSESRIHGIGNYWHGWLAFRERNRATTCIGAKQVQSQFGSMALASLRASVPRFAWLEHIHGSRSTSSNSGKLALKFNSVLALIRRVSTSPMSASRLSAIKPLTQGGKRQCTITVCFVYF